MCTVTWTRGSDGYQLLFNRDELRSRKEADPPRLLESEAPGVAPVRYLAPVDADFGGTWITVNECGVAIGLLNGFRSADAELADFRSRGLLVRDLAGSRTVAAVADRLRSLDLTPYRSFRLLALEEGSPATVAEWDRRSIRVEPAAEERVPLISSSIDESEVGDARREEFAAVVGDRRTPDRLAAFHESHANGPSAYSVCMHRDDAATRSRTLVRVGGAQVEIRYRPGNPCERAAEVALQLARAKVASS